MKENRKCRVVILAGALCGLNVMATASMAIDPDLLPLVECILKVDGTWHTLWGYNNRDGETKHEEVGNLNRFTTPPDDRGQPEFFFPGEHRCAFWTEQPADSSLTWTLRSNTATADGSSPECTDQFPPERVSSSAKGSLLIFSKVEIKWSGSGQSLQLLQDTFLDFSNDYPQDVDVQAYFVNGDIALEEERDPTTGSIIQTFEPGWNTADCRFKLTGGQPHYWSAAHGSNKCQPFAVLDAQGPGRLDPEAPGTTNRVLRGYVIMWAVDFDSERNLWAEIRWNHLKGDGILVNYANGTAWEYNAWSFQAGCATHGEFTGTPGVLLLNGVEYSKPFSELHLDFYDILGSEPLSGGGRMVQTMTDLTLHPVPIDLRQDNFGPVLTKVVADVCDENESCNSGARRCICCWDQTLLNVWPDNIGGAINTFDLRTSKGKARLTAGDSVECDFEDHCGLDESRRPILLEETTRLGLRRRSDDPVPILGLATKFLAFTGGGTPEQATAGMNIPGSGGDAGDPSSFILYDIQHGSDEIREDTDRNDVNRPGNVSKPAVPSDRATTLRTIVEPVPSE